MAIPKKLFSLLNPSISPYKAKECRLIHISNKSRDFPVPSLTPPVSRIWQWRQIVLVIQWHYLSRWNKWVTGRLMRSILRSLISFNLTDTYLQPTYLKVLISDSSVFLDLPFKCSTLYSGVYCIFLSIVCSSNICQQGLMLASQQYGPIEG